LELVRTPAVPTIEASPTKTVGDPPVPESDAQQSAKETDSGESSRPNPVVNGQGDDHSVPAEDAGVDSSEVATNNLSKGRLIGHWKFERGTGFLVADSSQSANHGILNGATWTKEQGRGALFFDGKDDSAEIRGTPRLDMGVSSFILGIPSIPHGCRESFQDQLSGYFD
jgi:hypothetical protein